MKVKQVISESRNGKRMEVIAKDNDGVLHTLHIQQEHKVWKYFVGENKKGVKVFAPITV